MQITLLVWLLLAWCGCIKSHKVTVFDLEMWCSHTMREARVTCSSDEQSGIH